MLAWCAALFLIGLIVGYAFEFPHFSNTLKVERLVVGAMVAGAAMGAGVAYKLARNEASTVGKLRWWVSMVVLFVLFMPLFASWVNRLPISNNTRYVHLEFIEEKPFAQERFGLQKGQKIRPDGYYIYVIYEGKMVRFRAERQQFPGKQRGDLVMLKLRKGNLGFDWVQF